MATKNTSIATTNTTPNSCVDCKVTLNRRVTYLFKTGLWSKPSPSELTLKIPYAVAVNGKAHSSFAKAAAVINAYKSTDVMFVEPGQTVSLYLNSDAAPAHRTSPVFAVTPQDNDVEVIVFEKRGQLGGNHTPKLKETQERKEASGNMRKVDVYEATLSGDVWKMISHRYTVAQASALIAATTDKAISAAVLKLYDGTQKGSMTVKTTDDSGSTQMITVRFEGNENAKSNVANFDLYQDGLPRVHPMAYVAVVQAGLKAKVRDLQTYSAWRPLLGSILHRTGLSLDVTQLDTVELYRKELSDTKARDNSNVSQEEKRLFKEKNKADAAAATAKKALFDLTKERDALTALKKSTPGKVNPVREMALPGDIAAAENAVEATTKVKDKADAAWNIERDKNEPATVKTFRTYLSRCDCVKNIFDPWFMQSNAHDANTKKPNLQKDGNEQLHATHLHVTVKDPTLPVRHTP